MKRFWFALMIVGCGTTKDCGACGVNNSTTAESYVKRKLGSAAQEVTCITDDSDHMYLCSAVGAGSDSERHNFRCADSADAADKMKCIPWFATE